MSICEVCQRYPSIPSDWICEGCFAEMCNIMQKERKPAALREPTAALTSDPKKNPNK